MKSNRIRDFDPYKIKTNHISSNRQRKKTERKCRICLKKLFADHYFWCAECYTDHIKELDGGF